MAAVLGDAKAGVDIEEKKKVLSADIENLKKYIGTLFQQISLENLKANLNELSQSLEALQNAIQWVNAPYSNNKPDAVIPEDMTPLEFFKKAISSFSETGEEFRHSVMDNSANLEHSQLLAANTLILKREILALKANMLFRQAMEYDEETQDIISFLAALDNLEAAIPGEVLSPEEVANFKESLSAFDESYEAFYSGSYSPTSEKHQSITRSYGPISLSGEQMHRYLSSTQSHDIENQENEMKDEKSIMDSHHVEQDREEKPMPYPVGLKADASSDIEEAVVMVTPKQGSKNQIKPISENSAFQNLANDQGNETIHIDCSHDDEPLCVDVFFEAFRNLPKQIEKHPIITAGVVVVGLIALGCIYVGVTGLTHGAAAIPGAMAMGKASSAAAPILKDCVMALSLGGAGAIGTGVSAVLLSFFPKEAKNEETENGEEKLRKLSANHI